ncbi:hypothetical protein N0V88_001655 [Collariella sp. IMI 366227]|nr:hypothetical protein N0V88_001655 [Collariella sp. IMI 366227]
MSNKPIFVATHPRACSTAFERVFMTRGDILHCVHEPFGDAFYFGPERLSERYADDEEAREKSGFAGTTYKDVMDQLLEPKDNEVTSQKFHFTFLIRHPRRAIPSYYRCTIPPLSHKTGFHNFLPSEAGYAELRRLFDYLVQEGVISHPESKTNGAPANGTQQQQSNGTNTSGVKVTVVDADDLLDKPASIIRAFCEDVGIKYDDRMLQWGDEAGQERAVQAFEKWNGFHDDAIGSTGLRARTKGKKVLTEEEEDEEWREKYGEEGRRAIRECVDANVEDYEYLKGWAVRV